MVRFEGHFLGWKDNPNPVLALLSAPAKETSTGVLGLLNGSIDWTDSYLPTDQLEQIQEQPRWLGWSRMSPCAPSSSA